MRQEPTDHSPAIASGPSALRPNADATHTPAADVAQLLADGARDPRLAEFLADGIDLMLANRRLVVRLGAEATDQAQELVEMLYDKAAETNAEPGGGSLHPRIADALERHPPLADLVASGIDESLDDRRLLARLGPDFVERARTIADALHEWEDPEFAERKRAQDEALRAWPTLREPHDGQGTTSPTQEGHGWKAGPAVATRQEGRGTRASGFADRIEAQRAAKAGVKAQATALLADAGWNPRMAEVLAAGLDLVVKDNPRSRRFGKDTIAEVEELRALIAHAGRER